LKPSWFIALPVAVDPAADWFATLSAAAPRDLRRFHRADLHLTVAFLGACGQDAARAAWSVVRTMEPPDFDVTLGGLVPMGNRKKPSAIAVGLERGREAVAAYMTRWRGELLAAAGARPDGRRARPHITIGRPPRTIVPEGRAAIVDWARAYPPIGASVNLNRLALYTWSDDRSVRQFSAVETR